MNIPVLPQLLLIQAMILRDFIVGLTITMRVQFGSLLIYRRFSSTLVRFMSTGKKKGIGALWQDFFSNTSEWWDHRPEKINPRFPDFKHKQTGEALWLADIRNPQWVQAKVAAIPPGTLQSDVFAWARRLKRLARARQYTKTLEVFYQMQQQRMCPDKWTFPPVLNACAALGALEEGRRLHTQIIQVGCDSDVYVATCLVDMYAKCGSIEDAWTVFNQMGEYNVVSWNAMIGGCAKSGQGLKALELFRKMQQEGMEPCAITFVGALNACASVAALEEGRHIHEQIVQRGFESDVYISTCLVDMYAKCGSIEDAWPVFNKMPKHDVVSWSAMIGGCAKSGQGLKAIELFCTMHQEGVEPCAITFIGLLNACASVAALEEGRRVHVQIIERGLESDIYVANCLVNMYAKCGSMEDAWSVFNKMQEYDVVSCSAMIGGYVKSGQGSKAMELFWNMQQKGVEPDAVIFVGVLNACASEAALEEGKRVHEQIIEKGYKHDVYVANCLIDMYAKCGSMEDAWSVFNKMQDCSVVSWNTMIGGYVKSGQGLEAMELFQDMQQEGVEPNGVTFMGVLNACACVPALEEGRHIHEQIIQRGWDSNLCVANCLLNMYAKCGSIEDAWSVFNKMQEHDVVSWNTMIGGYVKSGEGLKVRELFQKMQQEGVEPDAATFVGMLNACASVAALGEGRRVHEQIIKKGCKFGGICLANSLVDMYAKCGSMEDAWIVFNKMRDRNVVSWSSMIGGHVKSGQGLKAIELFRKMQQEGPEPDAVTFLGVLNACASVAALEEGRRVHKQITRSGFQFDVHVANCLVDMYAKCGSIEDAWIVFNKMREHDVVSWNAMIGGYAMHGHGKKAIELFKWMGKGGVPIDGITFTCLLSACSHGGLVKEGLRCFKFMTSCCNMLATPDHYACMVDLLGRVGRLEEAEEMTKRMPVEKNASVWMSLLGACRIHGNIEMAEEAAKQWLELDPDNTPCHVLLSNTYAAAGQWDRMGAVEEARLERQVWEEAGRSWIEVKNVVHSFLVNDEEHPQILDICTELHRLLIEMSESGYVPDMRSMLHEEKKRYH